MRGSSMKRIRILSVIAAAIYIAVALPYVNAVSEIPVMQTYTTENSAILYIGSDVDGQKVEAQIGTEPVKAVQVSPADETRIVTWLLLDNSLSIAKADREKAAELMTDIVAGKHTNEVITLCTISDHLNIVVKESDNYAELKEKIDAISYEDQETYLTDVLDELLNEEAKRTNAAYVRCIVISDGVDNNPGGITREELSQRLSEQNIPIYTFGCKGEDQELKAMYALSRLTKAQSWTMADVTETLSISRQLTSVEVPSRAEIVIPEHLRDGTTKGIQLTFDNGGTAQTQINTPFGTVTPKPEPVPEPKPEPEPELIPEPVEEKSSPIWLYIGGALILAAGIAAAVFFLLKQKKEKNRVRSVSEGPAVRDVVYNEKTEFMPPDCNFDSTMILVGNNRTYMLSLTDTVHSERHFEAPLRDKITIGRNPGNQIVLDYDNSVSGFHCEIIVNGNMLKVRDLNSRNGTFIDGNQVIDTAEIANGSTLKLGRITLKVGIR